MFWKEFFYLQKSDRRAILTLLILAALVSIVIYALNFVGLESNPVDNTAEKYDKYFQDNDKKQNQTYNVSHSKKELFYFDPNTADSTQLERLGLQPWQIRNIYKYRAKGGIYRSKEDFAFVYGLTVKDYRRLAPYIRISEDYMPAATLAEVKRRNRYNNYGYEAARDSFMEQNGEMNKNYSPKLRKGEQIAINISDTTELKKIPGIGSYFARQTTRYRDLLGGFVSKDQLLEIENFPEEALPFIQIDTDNIKKMNVNKLTLAKLRRHPYINYYQARAITDYRRLHGEIKDIRELRLMKEFTEYDLKRIEPYIEY